MSVQQRRKFDPDFKRNAVLLPEEKGRTVTEVAESLGVGQNLLCRWRREYCLREEFAFPGNGRESLSLPEQQIRELGKALQVTRSGDVVRTFLRDFQGYVQTDGYAGYNFLDDEKKIFVILAAGPTPWFHGCY